MRFAVLLLSAVVAVPVCVGGGPPLLVKTSAPSGNVCPETPPGESSIFIRQDLERVISVFKTAEGPGAWWISDYFIDFVGDNACLSFSVMKQHPDTFETWLGDLARTSFEDRGGCVNVECRRQAAISTLQTVGLYALRDKPELRQMLERLLKSLREIKVKHSPA